MTAFTKGGIFSEALAALYDQAVRDTIARFEATGSPVITDGEQTAPAMTAASRPSAMIPPRA